MPFCPIADFEIIRTVAAENELDFVLVLGLGDCLEQSDVGLLLGEASRIDYAVSVFQLFRLWTRVGFELIVHAIGDDIAVGLSAYSSLKLILHEFGRIVNSIRAAEQIVVIPFVGEFVGPVTTDQKDMAGEILRLGVAARS